MSGSDHRPIIAIVGRPNVGKSTLFNRLVGRRLALVHDTPGVTRDRREGPARLGDLRARVIDTAGLEDADPATIEGRMLAQTETAVAGADLVLLLIDARAGVTPVDEHFAARLRKAGARVLLVANKCESAAAQPGLADSFRLGFGDPVAVSAEHGVGMPDLAEAVAAALEAALDGSRWAAEEDAPPAPEQAGDAAREDSERPLNLAIVGRPNVGKSTLFNRLLGEARAITGPEPGLTRDAVAIDWRWRERDIRLIDTAGLRRRARMTGKLERRSASDAERAIQYAGVVVLMIDAPTVQDFGQGIEKQDLTIARRVTEEGRALIVAANKWDTVGAGAAKLRAAIRESLATSLTQVRGVPLVTLSARDDPNPDRLMQAVLDIEAVWNTRVSTGPLNRWLAEATESHPPPMGGGGRRIRLRYMTQVKARPPTFALFVSRPQDLPASYLRYLANGLRDAFGLDGVPLRLQMRKVKNPYVNS